MKTEVKKITAESLREASELIRAGELVAFPTETVYGLGANAFDDDAVKRIFQTKGRPSDNPLIAHVHTDYDLKKLVDFDPPYAEKLRKAFLPGPLTMVYPSTNKVSPFVSAGGSTLAVRVPSHRGAQSFLKEVDLPVVAPSANRSKHVSPTSASHVLFDFDGQIPLILDGGRSEGGIESTVLDVTGEIPLILREGLITREMIASVTGKCEKYVRKEGEIARSPGMMYKHYAPACPAYLCESAEEGVALYRKLDQEGKNPYLMAGGVCLRELPPLRLLSLGDTPKEMAANLYEKLREGERVAGAVVAIRPKEQDGIMAGVMDRLTRACRS
ncbi:MAG: threonylcarbamoyl-AMP synthase [Clostridia bacterium]|nr:threonylcarbamoyl-AMP synthase [Clostridia bacterium]